MMSDTASAARATEDGVRFGRTLLLVRVGVLGLQGVDAMLLPANRRGLLGVNLSAGARVDGGLEVEREAMAQAPLTLGTAVVTGAGTLAKAGLTNMVHVVVADDLGDPPRELPLRQGVVAALRQAEGVRARNLGVLPLGAGTDKGRVSREQSVPIIIEEIIGYLRRSSASRFETITFLSNSRAEAAFISTLLERMRKDWWGLRA